MTIYGTWKKITDEDCSAKYPASLVFNNDGSFNAKADSLSRIHPVWDIGSYKISGATITMSTSNDAVIRYTVLLKDNTLTFEDPDGCKFSYDRQDVPS